MTRNVNKTKRGRRKVVASSRLLFAVLACAVFMLPSLAGANDISIPVHRSSLITVSAGMSEVMVANPDIADVHAHDAKQLTVVGKQIGRTNIRIFDKEGQLHREIMVAVGYDLPAIRKALKRFLPNEVIAVEMLNNSIVLTGKITSPAAADRAIKIASDFLQVPQASGGAEASAEGEEESEAPAAVNILNMMEVVSGQQVMLRVRVGEINRTALKTLGIDLNTVAQASGTGMVGLATGGGIASLLPAGDSAVDISNGDFLLPGGQVPTNTRGLLFGRYQPDGPGGKTVSGVLKALERDGLFKVLAEPNLVAISGEEAEFLAGGEIPVPVVQGSAGSNSVTVEYKPFGVGVKFTPYVLTQNRIRMNVQPEVSEISDLNPTNISGFIIPSINTRRARTTVELAPGESFMIAGLIKDQLSATIEQLPGLKELPILGALFRSTEFRRNETELVIAVTPYIVDPLRSSDVKLPTDDFRPASQMESFFYGALGSLAGRGDSVTETPGLEGPTGFMVD